ncbi:MAG: PEP-CTERM sorting domain-containing protein [Gemmataceae bacterium]|nr:PEP-CTERM sorting domain-containing protein [Gemmataceae bacterium]
MRCCMLAFWSNVMFSLAASAQVLYIGGTTYSQNFDTLANNPVNANITWVDDSTLPGWYEHKVGGTNSAALTDLYRANSGNSTQGHLYSFGSASSTDRALGSLASGATGTVFFGVRLPNHHATWVLTSFTVEFTMEQWRSGNRNDPPDRTFFEYKVSTAETDIHGTGYTANSAGDLVAVNSSGTGAIDGNLASNRSSVSFTVTGIVWNPGEDLWLRWRDPDNSSADQGMGIDDFQFTAVPEPASMMLVGLGLGLAATFGLKHRRRSSLNQSV